VITYKGTTLTVADWADREDVTVKRNTIYHRLYAGWSAGEALGLEPHESQVGQRDNSPRLVTHNGETMSIRQWCKRLRIPDPRVYARLCHGWSEHEALGFVPRKRRRGRKTVEQHLAEVQ